MEGVSFHSGSVAYEPEFLFNDVRHLALQSNGGWHTFYARSNAEIICLIHFHIEDGAATSALKAPFGMMEVGDISARALYDFISFVESSLRDLGARTITIRMAPLIFSHRAELLSVLLSNKGYSVERSEISAVIEVDGFSLTGKCSPWEQRKLRQASKEGCTFSDVPTGDWKILFGFIKACRSRKGYTLSMTERDIERVIETFPDHFRFFTVNKGWHIIAACISILVSPQVLYTFYFDHDHEFDSISPGVFLMNGIYDYCQSNDLKLLDLGTSALDGQPNFGLLDFKLNLGARPSAKMTFVKALAK